MCGTRPILSRMDLSKWKPDPRKSVVEQAIWAAIALAISYLGTGWAKAQESAPVMTSLGWLMVFVALALAVLALIAVAAWVAGFVARQRAALPVSDGQTQRPKTLKDTWLKAQADKIWQLDLVGSEHDGYVTAEATHSYVRFDIKNLTEERILEVEVMIEGGGAVQGYRLPLLKPVPKIYLQNQRQVTYINAGQSERYTLVAKEYDTHDLRWGGQNGPQLERPEGRWYATVTILASGKQARKFAIFVLTQGAGSMHAVYLGHSDV
jgi:hypothetical protein